MKSGLNSVALKSSTGSQQGQAYSFACNPDRSSFAGVGDPLPMSSSLAAREISVTTGAMPIDGSTTFWHIARNPSNGVIFATVEDIAAAAHNVCYTSTDNGDNWTLRTLPGNITVKHAFATNSAVFLLGAENTVYSSTDGVSWSTGTLPSAAGGRAWRRLVWDGSKLVAVADTNQDGVSFSDSATGIGSWSASWENTNLSVVAANPHGVYLATGSGGSLSTDKSAASKVFRSSDAVSWDEVGYFIPSYNIASTPINWIDNKFIIEAGSNCFEVNHDGSALRLFDIISYVGENRVVASNGLYDLIVDLTIPIFPGLYFRARDHQQADDHQLAYIGPFNAAAFAVYDTLIALDQSQFMYVVNDRFYKIQLQHGSPIVKQQLTYSTDTYGVQVFDHNPEVYLPDRPFNKYVALRNGANLDVPGRILSWQPDSSYKECDGLSTYQTSSIELRKAYPKVTRTYRPNPVEYDRINTGFCLDGSTIYVWTDETGATMSLLSTANNGSSWTVSNPTTIAGLITSMTKISSTFYATRGGDWPLGSLESNKLYTSTTPTTSWTERTLTQTKFWMFVTNISSTIIAVASDGSVELSTNAGVSWSAGTSIGKVVAEPAGPFSMGATSSYFYNSGTTLYVATRDGLYSTTNGTAWTLVFGMPCYSIAYNGKIWATSYGTSTNLTDWKHKSASSLVFARLQDSRSAVRHTTTPIAAIGEYFISQTGLFSRDALTWFIRDDVDFRISRTNKLGVLPLSSTTGFAVTCYPDSTSDTNPYKPYMAYIEIDDSVVQVPSSIDVPTYIKV